jgi:hypothetical protein
MFSYLKRRSEEKRQAREHEQARLENLAQQNRWQSANGLRQTTSVSVDSPYANPVYQSAVKKLDTLAMQRATAMARNVIYGSGYFPDLGAVTASAKVLAIQHMAARLAPLVKDKIREGADAATVTLDLSESQMMSIFNGTLQHVRDTLAGR